MNTTTLGLAQPVLAFLLDSSLRWGAILALLWLGLTFRPPRRADVRYALCLSALFAGLLIPLSPRWSLAILPPISPSNIAPIIFPIGSSDIPPRISQPAEAVPGAPLPRPEVPQAATPVRATPAAFRPLPWVVLAAWLVGTFATAARLAIGWRKLARLRSEADPLPYELLDECRTTLNVRRPVRLARHGSIGSPVTIGGWCPTILVPDSWAEWTAPDRRAALLHELSHIARLDDLMKLLQELIRIPLFFHPLVRWLLVRLDREREWLCDEAVVALGSDRVAYARLLLEQARRTGRILRPVLPFLERRTVAARIERLLEDPMLATSPPASRRSLALIGAAFLFATISLATARVQPARAQSPPASSKIAVPTRTVPGIVLDANEQPVPGATVVAGVQGENGLESQVMTTDAQGRFSCKLPLHDSSITILVHKPGSVVLSWSRFYKAQESLKEMVFHVPRVPPGRFVAELKDGNGRPLSRATVRVEACMYSRKHDVPNAAPGQSFVSSSFCSYPVDIIRDSPLEPLFRTTANQDGRFEFTAFSEESGLNLMIVGADGQHYRVRDPNAPEPSKPILQPTPLVPFGVAPPDRPILPKSDLITVSMARQGFVRSTGDVPVELIARPSARIEGRLISRVANVPLDSLSIMFQESRGQGEPIFSLNRGRKTTPYPDGRFSFEDMEEGTVNVMVGRTKAESARDWTYRAAQYVRLVSGETSRVEIEIIRGVEVEGVVLSREGTPVANTNLGAHGPAHPRSGAAVDGTKTDDKGRFRFRLPPGKNYIYVMGYGIGQADMTVDVPDVERFTTPDLVIRGQPLNLKEMPFGIIELQPPTSNSR